MRSNLALTTAALASALALAPCAASAQYLAPAAPPQYGVMSLRAGFTPDPQVMEGQGGGPVSLQSVDGRCRGYAQQAPSHVLMATSGFRYLAILLNASYDTTLLVQTPDGQIHCNDDGDGLQARIELPGTGPGPIRIWVGSYSSSRGGPYRIGFSELSHVRASTIGLPGSGPMGGPAVGPAPGIRPTAPALYGAAAVRGGFMPDPMLLSGSAGGPLRAGDIDGSCRGYITPEPSHVVTVQSPMRNLRFVVSAGLDTTLVVQWPDGRISCDDDGGEGSNPVVQGPTSPGQIRVWVGTYSSGRSGPYTLGLTEMGHITASSLGGGGPGPGPVVVRPPVVTPPAVDATRVDLTPNIPVTLFGPGMTSATLAVWSPRGGPSVEVGIQPSGGSLAITAAIGGRPTTLVTVPSEIARDAVVTVTQRRDGRMLVRAERPPATGPDTGAQMLLLVQWPRRGSAPEISEQWAGTFSDRAPRWAR